MLTKLMMKAKNKKGFTLIELIVVIAILGILAAILIPKFTGFQDKAKSTQALVDAKQVATAVDSIYIEKSAWPDAAAAAALSGVPVGEITMDAVADGGFTVAVGGHSAGRADANAKVALIS